MLSRNFFDLKHPAKVILTKPGREASEICTTRSLVELNMKANEKFEEATLKLSSDSAIIKLQSYFQFFSLNA